MADEAVETREAKRRQEEVEAYNRMEAHRRQRIQEQLAVQPTQRMRSGAMVLLADNNPTEEEQNQLNANFPQLQGQNALLGVNPQAQSQTMEYGWKEVWIGGEKQPYKLHYSAEGWRAIPPSEAGELAEMRAIALSGMDAVVVKCSREPNYPAKEADMLFRRAYDAVFYNLAVTFHEDAQHFMNTTTDPEAKQTIELINAMTEIAKVNLGQDRFFAAGGLQLDVNNQPQANNAISWLPSENNKLDQIYPDDQYNQIKNIDAAVATAKDLRAEIEKLVANVDAIKNSQQKMIEKQNGEKWMIEKPELLVKADELKKLENKQFDVADRKHLIKKTEEEKKTEISKLKREEIEKILSSNYPVDPTKSTAKLTNISNHNPPSFAEALNKLEDKEKRMAKIKTRLNEKINASGLSDEEKTTLRQELAVLDKALGKPANGNQPAVDGELKTKADELKQWNTNGRLTAITAAQQQVIQRDAQQARRPNQPRI